MGTAGAGAWPTPAVFLAESLGGVESLIELPADDTRGAGVGTEVPE